MPEIPRTKFNSPWTVAVIEAALNDVSSAKGSSESLTAALNAMRAEINSLSGGVHLKGAVDYYSDLPASPSEGDAYTVRYQGTSGTDPLGIEYAWATYQGTPQWIPIGVDPSVFAKQAEMNVVANAGAKNFAIPFNATSTTDITVTINADGSYTFVCTNVAENRLIRVANIGNLPSGAYTFSGTTGGSSSTYMLGLYNTSASAVKYQQTNAEETYTGNVSGFSLRVRVISGYSGTFTVYPMLRPAAIIDPTFHPFARTNPELTVLTDEDRAALVEIVDGGGKNRLKVEEVGTGSSHGTTYENNGVTYTVNNDGTVSLSGTASAQSYANLRLSSGSAITVDDFCNYNFVLSGCPSGGSESFCLSARTTNNTFVLRDTGNGVLLTNRGSYSGILVTINVQNGKDCSGIIFRPMICTKAAWGISHEYQPYRPSWQEMWDAIQALQSGGNRVLTMQPTEDAEPEEQEER